jgi:aspartyl-tRNA(Asn)/glutamyl-tRNA(Gln) amidotransferase subunit C
MSLSLAEVERIAALARLELTAAEKRQYQKQLAAVLDYVAMIDELDLEGVEPTAHAVARRNVMRDDVVEPSLPVDEVLFNAARTEDDQFLIQVVIEQRD